MIVLAESTSCDGLALQREEFEDAERLVKLAEEGRIQLVIPAFSFAEPYQTLARRRGERKELRRRLQDDLRLLGRSQAFAELAAMSAQVAQTTRRQH